MEVSESFGQDSGVAIDLDLTMHRSHPDASPHSSPAKLRLWQSPQDSAEFSLKQRMEDVLRDDRRAIQDPLAYRQAILLVE